MYHESHDSWKRTKPGWYEIEIVTASYERCTEMIVWLLTCIEKYSRHCQCYLQFKNSEYTLYVKFRYERDYIWFNLTWK